MGCGVFQEVSYNCADISIEKAGDIKQMKSTESASSTEILSTREETIIEDTTEDTTGSIETSKKPKVRHIYTGSQIA